MSNAKYLSCAETAKLVRQALKESFPGVKFGVRSSTYAGGASIRVNWLDGPRSKDVEAVTGVFEGAYFDGMIDYQGSKYHTLDGQPVHFGANYIFEDRSYSDALIKSCIDSLVIEYGGCQHISVEDYRQGRAYSWQNSGGCDMGRALSIKLSETSFTPRCVVGGGTLDRVKFTGDDGYGAGTVGPDGKGSGYAGYPDPVRVSKEARANYDAEQAAQGQERII